MTDLDPAAVQRWFATRIPDDWFSAFDVEVDRDEILLVGEVPCGDDPPQDLELFREATRDARIRIAREAQRRFDRTVSWGATAQGHRQLFTTLSVPAMTRLRFAERAVLDTLIDAGVARSRSDALAWCVRLVAANEESWLSDLRAAFATVERVRRSGPASNEPD